MNKSKLVPACLAAFMAVSAAHAQDLTPQNFKVLGTWNTLTQFNDYEEPLWTKTLPEASGGAIKGDIVSMSVMGLDGYENLNLLKRGVFDFGHITIGYVTGALADSEMMDMAGVSTTMEMSRTVAQSYAPALADKLAERQGAVMLATYPFSSAFIFCAKPIASLADLEGKKIRTYSASLADFVRGAGGVSVTVPFAEIAPALEKGVADCAITGSMSAYQTKLQEVTSYVYGLPLNVGLVGVYVNKQKWDGLDDATRDFMTAQIGAWENRVWDKLGSLGEQGINCMTGRGECDYGEPAGLTYVEVTPSDDEKRLKILQETVFPSWVERCGEGCKESWNASAGEAIGILIK